MPNLERGDLSSALHKLRPTYFCWADTRAGKNGKTRAMATSSVIRPTIIRCITQLYAVRPPPGARVSAEVPCGHRCALTTGQLLKNPIIRKLADSARSVEARGPESRIRACRTSETRRPATWRRAHRVSNLRELMVSADFRKTTCRDLRLAGTSRYVASDFILSIELDTLPTVIFAVGTKNVSVPPGQRTSITGCGCGTRRRRKPDSRGGSTVSILISLKGTISNGSLCCRLRLCGTKTSSRCPRPASPYRAKISRLSLAISALRSFSKKNRGR